MEQDPGFHREELALARTPVGRSGPARALAACRICARQGHAEGQCARLRTIADAVSLFAVPAFITDPLNRIVWVNRAFAALVGDPIADRVPPNDRLIHLLVAGVYRERFVQPLKLVASCLPSLVEEVEAGRLDCRTLQVVNDGLRANSDLKSALTSLRRSWNGVVEINNRDGGRTAIREQVSPIADPAGSPTGFHIGMWFSETAPELPGIAGDARPASRMLTPTQLKVACHYASGMDSAAVARHTGTSVKTARSHLESVYSRLGIHSRAELAALLVREGLV